MAITSPVLQTSLTISRKASGGDSLRIFNYAALRLKRQKCRDTAAIEIGITG